jgi:hypothetical protein
MKITITIPDAAIRQAIRGAHSRYWAGTLYCYPDGSYGIMEGEQQHRFGKAKIAAAIKLLSKDKPNFESFGRLCDGCCDGPDGDLLIQYACFGELKHG